MYLDTPLSSTLTTIALGWRVPFLFVFWCACRVRHLARPRCTIP